MQNNKIDLTKKDFSFVCPVKTSNMKSIDEGYFCGECKEKIYDVSNFTNHEYEGLKKSNSNVCVTFKKVVTVGLVLSLSACNSNNSKQNIDCNIEKNSSKNMNNLAPFNAIDKNETIKIDKVEHPVLGGKIQPLPINIEKE